MMESCATKEEDVGSYNSNNVKRAKLHSTLAALLDDPILADVPKKPTLSDVDTLISLELGSAMRISVLKFDNTSFGSTSGRIFAYLNIIRSYLMATLPFKISAYVTIPRFFSALTPLSL